MGIGTGLAARGLKLQTGRPVTTLLTGTWNLNPEPSVERETGIEPVSLAWKAKVLPLNYSRETWLVKPLLKTLFCRRRSPKTLNWVSLVEEGGFEPP